MPPSGSHTDHASGPLEQVGAPTGWRGPSSWSHAVLPEGPGPSPLEPLSHSPAQPEDDWNAAAAPLAFPHYVLLGFDSFPTQGGGLWPCRSPSGAGRQD